VSVVIRRGDRLDVPFLRSLLGFAYNWHVAVFDTDVSISRYVDGWGRHGDTALVAMDGGHSIGAAWFRLFPETMQGYGFLDAQTPELTIVVIPTRQRQGIGEQLLAALIERARKDGWPALSVSAQRDHADAPLFIDQGFVQVREEGETLTLQLVL
jgi:GNAT superfamily N-acetyltransferase